MLTSHTRMIAATFIGGLSLAACGGGTSPLAPGRTDNVIPLDNRKARPLIAKATVVATGLENPRGIAFGPDGRLYIAEGGLGGSRSTVGHCRQVPAPTGPYLGGFTARISAVDVATGTRTTVVSGLPSSQTAAQTGGFVSGVADVMFFNGTLYALISGAGCSHGLAKTFNSIDRISSGGSPTPIVNLSKFLKTHPVANPDPNDFEPDGTWYSFVAVRGAFYAVEPNHGEVDVVSQDGSISRLVDVSATQGHIVPTALAFAPFGSPQNGVKRGQFVLGNLNTFVPGSQRHAKVFRLTMQGQLSEITSKLTAVTGVAVHRGQIYALECFTGFYAPAPPVAHTGRVVQLGSDGSWHTIVDGLSFPTAMTFGKGDTLYISNAGFGQSTNTAGEIVKVQVPGTGD